MKYQTYTKYKPSGNKIIDKIPDNWEIRKLKYILSTLQSGNREKGGGSTLDDGIFSVGGEHVTWNGEMKLNNPKIISEEFYNKMNQGKIKIGDTLLVKDGATIGKTAFVSKKKFEKMAVNEHVFLIRSNNFFIPKLLYYLIFSDLGFNQIKLTETGSAQGGINLELVNKVYFPVTLDIGIQQKIADFLDLKTKQIDELIKKDKKLIELLKEKRIALINKAVTKGLDDNVKLVDSGVDWIGEIPEGWEVRRLKFVGKSIIGLTYSPDDVTDENGKLVLRSSNVQNNRIKLGDNVYVNKEIPTKLITREGDILICTRNGSRRLIGKSAYIKKENAGHTFGVFMTIFRSKHWRFVAYVLNADVFMSQAGLYLTSTINQLTVSNLDNMIIALPFKDEQEKIVKFLNQQTDKIDKHIKKIKIRIKLFEEYKKSLIYNAVTGKIKI